MDSEPAEQSKTDTSDTKSTAEKIKAKSDPIFPVQTSSEATKLTVQISAPSYLHSLKQNDAPPFIRPGPEAKPKVLIDTLVTEDDCIKIIARATEENLKRAIGEFLVEKSIVANYDLSQKNFLVGFLEETISYAAQRDFPPFKLACLMTMYLCTHIHFRWYYWISPISVWQYFKEIMIRHTIEDSPDGQEVFEPEECYDIISHFHTVYMSNLPLIHLLTFGSNRLKVIWPFKPK